MNRRHFIALLGLGGATGGAVGIAWAQAPREVEIMAMKFSFTPDTVKAKVGEPITFLLTSIDRIHGFKMPDFGVRADIVPGDTTKVTIKPEKAGQFAYFCDVFCGDGHEEMGGTLIVEA